MLVTGSNLFKQWSKGEDVLRSFTEVSVHKGLEILGITWSYFVFRIDDKIFLSGLYPNQLEPVAIKLPAEFSNNIKGVLFSGNDRCMLMADIANGKIWKCVLGKQPVWNWEAITKFADVEVRSDGEIPFSNIENQIINLSMGSIMNVCLTQDGNLYNIPEKVCLDNCAGKIIDVQCGHEHAILLTNAGYVYTWGNGRRCQLGNGELITSGTPQQVEALAGVHIVLVRAGGWHCCALAQSGDLYVWGWNESGQLGVKETLHSPTHKKLKSDEQVPSLAIPTLVEIYGRNQQLITDYDVIDVACGSKHTVIKLKDNSIWASGNNVYGQLGVIGESNLRYFHKVYEADSKCKIKCGPWSTVLK